MAHKDTGFHPQDADWTRGRGAAVGEANAIARRQIGMLRHVTMREGPMSWSNVAKEKPNEPHH